MTRRELFETSLARVSALLQFTGDPALRSAELQLEYLIDLDKENRTDHQRLHDVNIGLLAVREIEVLDDALADLLYLVAEQVELMKNEFKRKGS
jgi:hypothetical protein